MKERLGLILRLLILAACLGLLAWTVRSLGASRVLRATAAADPRWLGLCLIPLVGRYLVWGAKWNAMLRRRARVPLCVSQRILMAGVFINLTTPTAKIAGGVLRAFLLHRRVGWRRSVAFGWAVADQVTNLLGTLALGGALALGSVPFLAPGTLRRAMLVSGVVLLAATAMATTARGVAWKAARGPALARWVARLTPRRLHRTSAREGDVEGWAGRVLGPLLGDRRPVRFVVQDIGLSALSWGLLALSSVWVMKALGVDAPAVPLALMPLAATFGGTAVGAPGGIGSTELLLIELYRSLGVPPEQAAAGTLVHRALFYLFSLGWGAVALFREAGGLRAFCAGGTPNERETQGTSAPSSA